MNQIEASNANSEHERYVFTFGCGQPNANHYVVLEGNYMETRDRMFELFGNKWSMQYESEEDAGVEQ